jgi:hypothetical protein
MARYLNANYWKKAYLLEFKKNGILTDAFTFSVPPENEEFIFPQRKSETKTFGGAVVADYGNDLVQINLSGSTINQELKFIYRGADSPAELTGEQEIFLLRDLLRDYGKRDNLQEKEVYLYSLSGGKTVGKNPKWWKIFISQLDISRSKDKPFCYNYKFSATGVPEVNPIDQFYTQFQILYDKNGYSPLFANTIGNTISGWYDSVKNLVMKMEEVADLIEEYGGGFLSELSGYIGTARQSINIFNDACGRYADVINGIMSQTSGVAVDTVMLGDKVLSSAFRYYPTIISDVWNSCLDTCSAFKSIYNYCANLDETYFSESSWQSIKELFDDSVSDRDIADIYSSLSHEGILAANKSVAITSKNLNDLGIAVIPGGTGEDDRLIITYGYKVVSVTDAETSWDQIAQDYYGNATLSFLVATYNNLPTDKPLKVGQEILIPKLNFADTRAGNNEVYNTPDVKDNYGKDLIIQSNDFAVYNGDLKLVSGVDNLEQALLNRYSTLLGARIRLEAYGIQASIGNAVEATSALIQASVHQTTVEDPRVETVEDISFVGMGDELTVSVTYIDRNGAKRNFGGTI